MYYSKVTQAYSEKRKSECSYQELNVRLSDYLISDALSMSYERLVGAKVIKLSSWDKHPTYCYAIDLKTTYNYTYADYFYVLLLPCSIIYLMYKIIDRVSLTSTLYCEVQ